MSQKSLFAYFKSPGGTTQKAPKGKANNCEDENQKLEKENMDTAEIDSEMSTPKAAGKRKKLDVSNNKKASPKESKPKRRRVIISDESDEEGGKVEEDGDSSGEEFKPDEAAQSSESDSESDDVDEEEIKEMTSKKSAKKTKGNTKSSGQATPTTKKFKPSASSPALTNGSRSPSVASPVSIGRKTLDKLTSFSAPPESASENSDGVRVHQTLEFLKPDKIRDKEKRLRTDEGYDPRTLYIPPDFKSTITPAMRQWWELKENHFDTILFFKMGKFYEFFHMDADVGVRELGLVYMKGNHAHAGFPEIAYGRYADTLLRKGYKIARIEQTETPDMMNERVEQSTKKVTKFDKVVKREICQITTPGTRTPNFMDGENIDVSSNFLLAVCDKPIEKGYLVGVCFVDTSVGRVHVGQFTDDIYGSRLRTLVAHYIPGQILCEKRKQSPLLSNLFKTTLASVMKEYLTPNKEFWDCEKTIKVLTEGGYFTAQEGAGLDLPETLKLMIADSDTIARTAAEGYELAVRSLGAVVWYLSFCYLDQDILSMKSFEEYIPLDSIQQKDEGVTDAPLQFENFRMVLDSVTLANLDILINQSTGTIEGSLIERLDRCKTAGGKRLLREWISAPLCNYKVINERLDAVSDLMSLSDLSNIQSEMKKLPDFERLLSRIHSLGHSKRNRDHPESRAIMFENEAYSKRKIESFLTLLTGFRKVFDILPMFDSAEVKSNLLKKCINLKSEGGHMPDIRALLDYFDEAFDHESARKAGAIHPAKGYVEEYDESTEEIKTIDAELKDYLNKQKKLLQSSQVNYVGTGRNRYQLEVPDSASKRVPSHYEVTGQRKGFRRYVTPETKALLTQMMEAEDKQVAALKDTMRKIFSKFDESYRQWMDVVQCINVLDVLMSLASYSMTNEGVMSRPGIIPPGQAEQPFIEIRDGRHPSAIKTYGGGDFIPNDTVIGCHNEVDDEMNGKAELLLLTGPNMGGKSTLMRQVGLITVMAQLGCYVPAEKCRLTPVDRMFTRLGASDRIMYGESTFFVELSETSIILQHATKHSLVLLDELGRGTATHDGTAIASAVVNELASTIKCRTIFSTHYHSLVEDFVNNEHIQLGHMACMVNEPSGDNYDTDSSTVETITFLYKLAPDFCPKSYGFNVAKLAGLPDQVIKLGLQKTQELEKITESRRALRSILMADKKEIVRRVKALCSA